MAHPRSAGREISRLVDRLAAEYGAEKSNGHAVVRPTGDSFSHLAHRASRRHVGACDFDGFAMPGCQHLDVRPADVNDENFHREPTVV